MEGAIRLHASPVGRSITTNGHIITGCGRTGILGCHVLFLIALELPTLMPLVAMHHGQIAGGVDGGIFVGAEIFAPHIHDPKLFGLHILIFLELFQNTSCTPCQRILTVAEHRRYLIGEQVTQLAPQFGVSSVKHILCADSISVLVAISQSQTTLVIIAHSGIVIVVKAEVPVNQIAGVREHVLCAVINHGVPLSKQIMENSRIQIEVILEMCLEFLIIRIHHPVLSCDPRLFAVLDLFLSAGRIAVTELKGMVAVPSFLREIAAQEAGLLIGVVVDLNDKFLVILGVHTHRIIVLFGVANVAAGIEVPLTIVKYGRIDGISLLNKHDTGIERHGITHFGIILFGLTHIGVKFIEIIRQQGVVCILRRSNIDFDVKILLRNAIFGQCIGVAGSVVTKGKAALAVDINVSGRIAVVVRAGALALVGAGSSPVVFLGAAILIDLLDRCVGNLVLLAGGESGCRDLDDTQVRTLLSQQVRGQFAACVGNIVAHVARDHLFGVLRIGNKVVQNLIICQVHAVALHAVHNNVTIVRANGNTNGSSLSKAVAGIIQFNTAGNTITPQNHLTELLVGQNIKLELEEIVLTDGQINTVLMAGQRNFLSLNTQTNAAIQASHGSSIIVANVRCLKHQLKILAALLCIVCEKLIADGGGRASLDTEISVAIFVDLVATVHPVKVVADSHLIAAGAPQAVHICVAAASGVKVQHQAGLNGLNGNAQVFDLCGDALDSSAASNGQSVGANIRRFKAPSLSSTTNSQCRSLNAVNFKHNACSRRGRVIDSVNNADGTILFCGELLCGAADDRCVIAFLCPHDIFINGVTGHSFAIDICSHGHFQQVSAVFLCRNRIGHLSAGNRSCNTTKLFAIQSKGNVLIDISVWSKAESNLTTINQRIIEDTLQIKLDNIDIPSL